MTLLDIPCRFQALYNTPYSRATRSAIGVDNQTPTAYCIRGICGEAHGVLTGLGDGGALPQGGSEVRSLHARYTSTVETAGNDEEAVKAMLGQVSSGLLQLCGPGGVVQRMTFAQLTRAPHDIFALYGLSNIIDREVLCSEKALPHSSFFRMRLERWKNARPVFAGVVRAVRRHGGQVLRDWRPMMGWSHGQLTLHSLLLVPGGDCQWVLPAATQVQHILWDLARLETALLYEHTPLPMSFADVSHAENAAHAAQWLGVPAGLAGKVLDFCQHQLVQSKSSKLNRRDLDVGAEKAWRDFLLNEVPETWRPRVALRVHYSRTKAWQKMTLATQMTYSLLEDPGGLLTSPHSNPELASYPLHLRTLNDAVLAVRQHVAQYMREAMGVLDGEALDNHMIGLWTPLLAGALQCISNRALSPMQQNWALFSALRIAELLTDMLDSYVPESSEPGSRQATVSDSEKRWQKASKEALAQIAKTAGKDSISPQKTAKTKAGGLKGKKGWLKAKSAVEHELKKQIAKPTMPSLPSLLELRRQQRKEAAEQEARALKQQEAEAAAESPPRAEDSTHALRGPSSSVSDLPGPTPASSEACPSKEASAASDIAPQPADTRRRAHTLFEAPNFSDVEPEQIPGRLSMGATTREKAGKPVGVELRKPGQEAARRGSRRGSALLGEDSGLSLTSIGSIESERSSLGPPPLRTHRLAAGVRLRVCYQDVWQEATVLRFDQGSSLHSFVIPPGVDPESSEVLPDLDLDRERWHPLERFAGNFHKPQDVERVRCEVGPLQGAARRRREAGLQCPAHRRSP
ncbi:hypothetical protein CYMTET_32657 [Cymbomonas tetramitiformis]|uniref:Uncharacterized protein n=1 Tax=Cymbomonas tetramitiformis TaxID=36881 RepID=A0AAE0FEN6_9CHLO|nr:hypothetical protein CYMTET_32657 [Cymbomonas tetramitiformis]